MSDSKVTAVTANGRKRAFMHLFLVFLTVVVLLYPVFICIFEKYFVSL